MSARAIARAAAVACAVVGGCGDGDRAVGDDREAEIAAVTSPAIATTAITTFLADADARVAADTPEKNFGSSITLRTDGSPATRSYLRFVVSGLDGAVTRATLRLRVTEATVDGPAVYAVSNAWTESTITYARRPLPSGSWVSDAKALAVGDWATWDVTRLVSGNGIVSFVLVGANPDGVGFASRESADQPQLVVAVDRTRPAVGSHAPALVAASHPLAVQAGADILRRGGNAVDAAAAVALVLGVVEPHASGLGGGSFFMLYRADTRGTYILDGRERAPAAATPDQFLRADATPLSFSTARTKGIAVGVPGLVRTLEVALARHGTMSLAKVIPRAITLASSGFRLNTFVAQEIAEQRAVLALSPASAAIYLPGGVPLAAGATFVQPDLARTLRLVRDGGARAFYEGAIAGGIVTAQAQRGGRMTLSDLATYPVLDRVPLEGGYRALSIVALPPPSSGGLTGLQLLGLLEPFELRRTGPASVQTYHLLLEAMHLSFADRARWMGDADFSPVPETGLLAPDYLDERRALMDPERASTSANPGDPWPFEDGGNTTHFVVIDRAGNIVTSTQSIEASFGTGITVPGYGFVLNNQLTDFDFTPGGPNQVEPFKRPRSSMAPTIAFRDGAPVFVLGSPGGARIITTVTQVFLGVVEHGLPLQQAIDAPRIHFSRFPTFQWEAAVPQATLDGLRARGHSPASSPTVGDYQGSVQAALRTSASSPWVGGADRRREGAVVYVQ